MMKSKELKTKIYSHAHSLILWFSLVGSERAIGEPMSVSHSVSLSMCHLLPVSGCWSVGLLVAAIGRCPHAAWLDVTGVEQLLLQSACWPHASSAHRTSARSAYPGGGGLLNRKRPSLSLANRRVHNSDINHSPVLVVSLSSPSHTHTITHSHTLLITCICCYDEIKGTKDQDFSYSFSDSLFSLSLRGKHCLCTPYWQLGVGEASAPSPAD